ncbi:MAG: hypothetical protein BA863_04060 [Desulfovibrio sp. S3730MH75]|nr:MAG: hypothetical protein BA863_04060 [Desulfovibrio sp. S3730MH75]
MEDNRIKNRSKQDEGTLQSILRGKSIVDQRLAGRANPEFWKKGLTDKDYLRIGTEGTKDISPRRTVGGTAKDIAITAAKGVVGLGEAAVGLADIPTLGRAGKALESIGYDAGATQEFLGDFYSEPQKKAFSEVEKAEGFWGTTKAMLQHPTTIAHAVLESGPQMLGSAAMARKLLATGILKASPAWNNILAAAIGEGVVGMGATAEGIRTQTKDGLLTAKQAAASVASGFGTGIFAIVGGRISEKLGIVDPDTFLAGGSNVTPAGLMKRIIGGGISEGAFEELPQSMQEQVWLNAAMDKPLLDGVAEAGAAGLLTGAAMGGGFGALAGREAPVTPPETAKDILVDETKKEETAKDILTKEPEVALEETLAAEEAAAGITEKALAAAEPVKEVALEPTPAPKWVEALADNELSKRAETLQETEKERGLSEKQKNNLGMIQEELVDRGLAVGKKKEAEDAKRIRREAEEAGRREELEQREKERIRLRDTEKDRLAAEKKKADEAEKEIIDRRKEERPGEEDRRVDIARRKRISEMTPAEMGEELLTSPVTKMPNRRAMEEREQVYADKGESPSKAFLDVDSLKYVNDIGGHAAGDELLNAVARTLEEVTSDSFHISGDEFIILGKTDKEANDLAKRVNEKLAKAEIEFTNKDGDVFVYKGMGVSYGIHKTEKAADELLRKHKKEREAEGVRAGRGERPPGLREKDKVQPIKPPVPRPEKPKPPKAAEAPISAEPILKPTPKVEKVAVPEFEGVDLRKITVEVDAIREETGETIKVKELADVAIEAIDKDIETYYSLLACL